MADNFYVSSPKPLSFGGGNPSNAWEKWKLRFDIFLQATGAAEKTDSIKVGLLLHHIGDDGLEIYSNFTFLGEDVIQQIQPRPCQQRASPTTTQCQPSLTSTFTSAIPSLCSGNSFGFTCKESQGRTLSHGSVW